MSNLQSSVNIRACSLKSHVSFIRGFVKFSWREGEDVVSCPLRKIVLRKLCYA